MQRSTEWKRRPLWTSVGCFTLCITSITLAHATMTSDQTGDDGSTENTTPGETETRFEPWMFVSVPQHGVASLQDVMTEGTEAFEAFMSVGEPLDSYSPIDMLGTNQNANNGAVVMYFLPQNCLGDYDSDGAVTAFDLPYFIEYYVAEDPEADLTRDGQVDVRDQVLFVELTNHACYDAWGW